MTSKKKQSPKVDSLSDEKDAALLERAVATSEEMIALDDMIKMVGETPPITRFPTGLPWLDWALGMTQRPKEKQTEPIKLGDYGWPSRTMSEFYGWPASFKSTLAEYVAGKCAVALGGNIVLLEFERMLPEQVQMNILPSGFRGEVYSIPLTDKKNNEVIPLGDEERIRKFRKQCLLNGYAVGILDPIGSYIPTAEETEDSMDESHMGVWARHTAKYARNQIKELQTCEHPYCVFLVDHMSSSMSGEADSPGKRWKHSCGVRLRLSKWWKPKTGKAQSGELKDGSWVVGVEVKKNKFGPEGREFSFVVKAGRGVHPGLSAVHACMQLDLCEVGKTGYITLGGEKFGTFNQMVADKWRDAELFAPFTAALEAWRDERLAEDAK